MRLYEDRPYSRAEFDVSPWAGGLTATCPVCWGSHGCDLRPGHDGDVHVCLDDPLDDDYDPTDVVCSTSEGNQYIIYPDDWSGGRPTPRGRYASDGEFQAAFRQESVRWKDLTDRLK